MLQRRDELGEYDHLALPRGQHLAQLHSLPAVANLGRRLLDTRQFLAVRCAPAVLGGQSPASRAAQSLGTRSRLPLQRSQ
jgi:hypothetical protein